jgi:hypothetical protein
MGAPGACLPTAAAQASQSHRHGRPSPQRRWHVFHFTHTLPPHPPSPAPPALAAKITAFCVLGGLGTVGFAYKLQMNRFSGGK